MSQLVQSLTVVVPIIFVLAFGFFAGKTKAFGADGQASIKTINHYVLTFALPPSLFVGTISVSKAQLLSEMVLFYSLFVSLLIAFAVGLVIAKYMFKRNMVEASIAGLAVSFSAGPFYGPALLGSIYGEQSGVAVSMISLVINVFIVPLATVLIKIDLGKSNQQQSETQVDKLVMTSIYEAIFKTPFVWAPLLAFILVFMNVELPHVVADSLGLIGKATAGTAVFVAGLTIAANKFKLSGEVLLFSILKNIALPVLFTGVAFLFLMKSGNPVFNQGLLLAALPSGPMIVLLATKYNQYQEEASSILALTTLGMMITVTALIAVLKV